MVSQRAQSGETGREPRIDETAIDETAIDPAIDEMADGAATPSDYVLFHDQPDPVAYPRRNPDVAPIGGRIRVTVEDFEVEEIPLYAFAGTGEHCYVTVRKVNRSTLEAREYLARELGVQSRDIGFAGFKDRRAVAQQTFSIAGIQARDAANIQVPWLQVINATYHRNKLRTGHLRGNKFRIIVRGVQAGSFPRAQQIATRLREEGLPNYYGPQRFGHFSDGYKLGRALLHRRPKEVVELMLAPRPGVEDEFRELYQLQRYEEALKALPPGRAPEAAMLHALRRYPGNARAAVRKIPREMKRMYYSAYQSFLFNWCLKERLQWGDDAISVPVLGDLAFIHDKGACFLVEDLDEGVTRARTAEISPSGPMFGRKMRLPQLRPGLMERAVMEAENLRPQSWLSHVRGVHLNGTRRPYRVPVRDLEVEELEPTVLKFTFTLPPGAFATILLEEIMGAGLTRLRSDDPDPVVDVEDD